MNGIESIAAERQRQIDTEAMTPCAGWRSRKLAYDAGVPITKL